MLTQGQIVYSKSGRDKGRMFVVHSVTADYVMIVDGELRTLAKPKKKKLKHVQHTNTIDLDLKNKLENNLYLLDADIRKVISALKQ